MDCNGSVEVIDLLTIDFLSNVWCIRLKAYLLDNMWYHILANMKL